MALAMTPVGAPCCTLELKAGCSIMAIRAILHPKLANGARLIFRAPVGRSIIYAEAQPADGSPGEVLAIPRIDFQFVMNDLLIRRSQFPICQRFAVAILKSQALTLAWVGVGPRNNIFARGQLYVAISRARKSSSVMLLRRRDNEAQQPSVGADHPIPMPCAVENIVLPEAIAFANGLPLYN